LSDRKATLRRLGPVLLAVLLDLLGFGIVIPLLPYYAESYGATEQQAMALMGIYSVSQLVFAPIWGALSDKLGRRPVMLVSIAATAVFLTAFAAAPSLLWLFVFRGLHGAAAANISTAQAYVADVTTPEERAMGMGLIGASFGVGFTLGPLVGGVLAQYGLAVPFFLAAGLSAANFLWAVFGLPESRPVGAAASARRVIDPRRILAALRHPVVGAALLLTFTATFAFSMMEVAFGLVAEHTWFPDLTREDVAMEVGKMFGLIGVVGIVIQGGLMRRLSQRFGEPPLVVTGYAFQVLGLAGLAFAQGGWETWVVCGMLAVGSSLANPALQALISRGVDADSQGSVLGVNQSLSALARASAPWVALFAYGILRSAPFLGAAALMFMALLLALPATRRAAAR
jgi:DHA1 family tetracycline resistance protein-like MFS transporter